MINSRTDLRLLVAETVGIPIALVEEIPNPSSLNLSEISKGLVMVFARWSPFPLLCLRRMKGIVPPVLIETHTKLLVIDNDKLSANDMRRLFGATLSGAAETFAIVDGQIRGESIGCPENYEAVLKELSEKLARKDSSASSTTRPTT